MSSRRPCLEDAVGGVVAHLHGGVVLALPEPADVVQRQLVLLLRDVGRAEQALEAGVLRVEHDGLRLRRGLGLHQAAGGVGRPQHLLLLQQHGVDVHGGELALDLRLLQVRLLVVALVLQLGLQLLARHRVRDLDAPDVELVEVAVQRGLVVPALLHGEGEALLHRHAALEVLREPDKDGLVLDGVLGAAGDDGQVAPRQLLVQLPDLVAAQKEGEVHVHHKLQPDGLVGPAG
mmetsp:Transcript_37678/g.93309  ORF Transcript_37678/g.93309 Transcript_37678/m.93309 type:complete len:233 (+) Transcript_37678:397-1095(+)